MNETEKKLQKAMLKSLIDCWHDGKNMDSAVRRAYILADEEMPRLTEAALEMARIMRSRVILLSEPVKIWVARNIGILSNCLWEGRTTERCLIVAMKAYGYRPKNSATRIVRVRDSDKRHDWNTVK